MRFACILFLSLVICSLGCAVDVYYNDTLWASYSQAELLSLAYAIPADAVKQVGGEQDGGRAERNALSTAPPKNGPGPTGSNRKSATKTGISLDELFPVLIDAYRLTVTTDTGEHVIKDDEFKDDDLAEMLHSMYLLEDGGGWTAAIGTERSSDVFPNVESLTIYGEKLEDSELEVWVSWEETDLLKEEINRFSRLHNVDIKVTEVPKTDSKLVSILRGGGPMPDVVMVQSDYVGRLTAAEALQPVGYVSTQPLLENGLNAFSLYGKQWALPVYFDTQLVFMNTGLVDADFAGEGPSPDWTLSDVEDICRDLKAAGVTPLAWNAYSAYWLIPFQKGFGKTTIIDEDGGITINDEPTKEALRYILSLQEKGFLDVRERDGTISRFISGDIGMILAGSYSIPHFRDLGIDFTVQNYPSVPQTGRPLTPMLDFKGFAITKKTKHPILARRLIQYLCGIGVQQRFPAAAAKLPACGTVWPLLEETGPLYEALLKSAETGTVVPPHPAYTIFKNTMWKLLRFIVSGRMSIETALDNGQAIIDRKVEQAER